MTRLARRLVHAAVAGAALVAACSSSSTSDPGTDIVGACRALASACHDYDEGGGLAHECHTLGHETTDDAACARRRAECLAACPPRDPHDAAIDAPARDAGEDARGAVDAAADADAAGGDPCVDYCGCLGETCAAVPGYPHASGADCLAACQALSSEQKDCWPKFCARAKAGVSKVHNCEHAWGRFGLDECEGL